MATNVSREFWKSFGGSITRFVMGIVGTWLQTKGILTSEQTEHFSSLEVAATVAGLILMGFPIWWAWAKANFAVLYQRALHLADRDKPVEEIKREVLKKNKNVAPL